MNTPAPKTSPDAALGNLMAAALDVPAPSEPPEVPAWATGDLQDIAKPLTAAARDVLAERQRQISVEGFNAQRDDGYTGCQLARAAAGYAVRAGDRIDYPPLFWPWENLWWKPRDQRHDLVRAGALILAEIERLDRAAIASQQGKGGAA